MLIPEFCKDGVVASPERHPTTLYRMALTSHFILSTVFRISADKNAERSFRSPFWWLPGKTLRIQRRSVGYFSEHSNALLRQHYREFELTSL